MYVVRRSEVEIVVQIFGVGSLRGPMIKAEAVAACGFKPLMPKDFLNVAHWTAIEE
jgi:hypothetical protein